MFTYLSIYTDGGSRGNPGPAAYGFVIRHGETIIHQSGKTIGIATNNVAEYSGILEALSWIFQNLSFDKQDRESQGEISGIHCYMDSQLACRQLQGVYKIKQPHLFAFIIKIREMEKKLHVPITYHHIPREKNKEADRLVNAALDGK